MSDEQQQTPSRNRRGKKRGARGKLRKNQEIDHVLVEDTFQMDLPDHVAATSEEERKAGEGCYVSTTIHNRRYYGVLVDQATLKTASLLYFQDEASGLDLNRKMEYLIRKRRQDEIDYSNEEDDYITDLETQTKKPRLEVVSSSGNVATTPPTSFTNSRQVQKFRYVQSTGAGFKANSGYRLLLATFANVEAASEDDTEKLAEIELACRSGGNYVGKYFYQYEVKCSTLQISDSASRAEDIHALRMSMGFQSFLQTTPFPDWFPLSNLQVGQQKVLSLLNMKKDNNGNITWDESTNQYADGFKFPNEGLIPMEPRSRYRICIVGGGIAGLSCCLELLRICDRERIDVEIVLVEGRSRFGGRLMTDQCTFKGKDGITPFPVDLGASWIHGITLNPLASLAREAGADFITTSEDVTMLQSGMSEVDKSKDENASRLFDKLLDLAAHDCWKADNTDKCSRHRHDVNRWYASVLDNTSHDGCPPTSISPLHRQSDDVSVDSALGKASFKHRLSEFALLSDEERNMLTWNTKNVEYALGANIKDVSMKFWDIDERHAFEGDHVMLKQGYSTVVEHLLRLLKQRGDRFKYFLDFPVGKLEYNRKSTTQPYIDLQARSRKFIELSDTCCVTSRDKSQSVFCDFIVSAVPLGVLKMTMKDKEATRSIDFQPPLPFIKSDAISSVGFGLLNKAFVQFSHAFWRKEGMLKAGQTQFGNVSGVNPHHYMFVDIGMTLVSTKEDPPAILMSLISGREAVACEQKTDEDVVREVMETLRELLSSINIPEPIAHKVTRWGSDEFSRGSYTFLTPGSTDEDFEVLQSPVNGNGDSILLEGSETMRLFFAGEHTTALHPSMTHGAQLSGVRTAQEIADTMVLPVNFEEYDRLIPMSMFRYMNPQRRLHCCLCNKSGTSIREGKLLAFKKGTRLILCHTNCAENSPDVDVFEGKWKDVFSTINQSRFSICNLCDGVGATIGCLHEDCQRQYHFVCGEDTGWRFHSDGKEFYCDLHRSSDRHDSRRVSMQYACSKGLKLETLTCRLCASSGIEAKLAPLCAFQRIAGRQEELLVVHENCIAYTTIVDLGENNDSGIEKDYKNAFNVVDRAETCFSCGKPGATVCYTSPTCGMCYHVLCADSTGWKFDKHGSRFLCQNHRGGGSHFSKGEAIINTDDLAHRPSRCGSRGLEAAESSENDSDDYITENEETIEFSLPIAIPLAKCNSRRGILRLSRLVRETVRDRWNVDLYATGTARSASRKLKIASSAPDPHDQLEDGDVVQAINGIKIGSPDLDSLQKVFALLSQEVEAMLEVRRDNPASQWS